MKQGLIHIYYGYGKGKTTAAIGLSYRAFSRGLRVGFASFLKTADCPELSALAPWKTFPPAEDFGFWKDLSQEERMRLRAQSDRQLKEAFNASHLLDLLVLDEVVTAYALGAVDQTLLLSLLQNRPSDLEVVMTGHTLPKELESLADYITEFIARRHPYEKGVPARKGIEY